MKKVIYVGAIFWLGMAFSIQSCEKKSITPSTTINNTNDSIIGPNDSLGNGGGSGTDSTGWTNPGGNGGNTGGSGNGGNSGGGSGTDSTGTGGNWNPNDSTGMGGN